MPLGALLVNVAGIVLIGMVVWYFRLAAPGGVRSSVTDGLQSALVVVKGGFVPDTVVFDRGRPARLIFRREEVATCSERVLLPAFGQSVLLPQGEEVFVDFVPTERGEFPFTCHLGKLRGRIVVE